MSAVVTKLRVLYDQIGELSTATQIGRCSDFLRAFEGKDAPLLISWFAESLSEIQSRYGRINQPFLDAVTTKTRRKALGTDSTGTNRVVRLLKEAGEIRVFSEPLGGAYRFRYIERELPTLRAAAVGRPKLGSGGIDYVALRTSEKPEQPCLGEIKVGADQNAFYAFIQLLTYLSELATEHQIERANKYALFGTSISENPSFDLHILLADFNQRGKKGELTGKTEALAKLFKESLRRFKPALAGLVGSILCLEMDSERFEETKTLDLLWKA